MFFKKDKVFLSADFMPIKRYILAITTDIRFFYVGDEMEVLSKKKDSKYLEKAILKINSTIIKTKDREQLEKKINLLNINKSKLLKMECLLLISNIINQLLSLNFSEDKIKDMLKKTNIGVLFLDFGLSLNDFENIKNINNFKIQYLSDFEQLNKELNKDKKINSDFYLKFCNNLLFLKKQLNISFDENKISINEYLILINSIYGN